MSGRKSRDITGLRVGMLVARYIYKGQGSGKPTLWFCECDCGGSILKPLSDLVRTKFSSCGCTRIGPTRKDHTGVKYGKAVGVSATDKTKNSQVVWKWKCDCGAEFEAVAGNFVYKNNGSCPTCAKENSKEATRKRATTHGLSGTKEYRAWRCIKERCYNPNSQDFPDYGGRGIRMFEGWMEDFLSFYNHIGPCPTDGKFSIDRIDVNGNYEPGNVRWATDAQQARNKGKMKNNTSGVTGVHWEDKVHPNGINSTRYAVAQWHDQNGKICKKSYSVKKYGEELAFFLACEKRDLEIMRLNLQGASYAENHGK